MASLDLETTGIDPLRDRVVSYALLDLPGEEHTGLVRPGVPVPEAASQVHGLTDAALASAPAAPEALLVVLEWLAVIAERRVGLVVFNAGYDLTMLRAEARRHGLAEPDWQRLHVVDPFVLDWGVDRLGARPRRLVDVAQHYGVTLHEAHDAANDARAAREVAVEIGARHEHVGARTLGELVALQAQWYAERAEVWNVAARESGRPLADPYGWPLLP